MNESKSKITQNNSKLSKIENLVAKMMEMDQNES